MAQLLTCVDHLPPDGPLSLKSADAQLQVGDTLFPVHRDYLEGQSYLLQGLFESHAAEEAPPGAQPPVLQLVPGEAAPNGAGGAAIAAEARQALQPAHLARFLYQAYHPEEAVSCEGGEGEVLDLLVAADFFSDDSLKAKCDAALAGSAARRLKGLHDPLPLTIDSPTKEKLGTLELEDSATTVLQEHGSPVKPAGDEWDTEVHALMANNVKARDRQELVRYTRLASRYELQALLAECLPHLCKLIVAASSHHNLRHTVQECLPLLDDPAKTVVLFEVAQLAANAAGDQGILSWNLDSARMLTKLQEYEAQEAVLSRNASLAS